ncbi:HD family phosphohydrolase [Anaerotalea alkaliphila]|uniref:HD family phosphohydrolase n=1 Tax=Anaerotalea alkaliphila TaxID=2662126 RepID=UPI001BA87AD7|nr:HD family phosphohydrolase [Anaerotalea alkaliphila]
MENKRHKKGYRKMLRTLALHKPKREQLDAYYSAVEDLIENAAVLDMDAFIQHGRITCLEHSLHVSFVSFKVARKLGLRSREMARGGLLHDFFLYDWHVTKCREGKHAFAHPVIAKRNAERHFTLNEVEKDVIVKHMWPVTLWWPRHRESWIIIGVDKYCAVLETSHQLWESLRAGNGKPSPLRTGVEKAEGWFKK